MLDFLKDLLEKWRGLFKPCDNNVEIGKKILKGLEHIMGTLKDVTDSIDELHTFVGVVDVEVEALYEQIKQFTNDGITPATADILLAKLGTMRQAVEKVQTDDEPEVPPA